MALYQEARNKKNELIGYLRTTDNASIPIALGNRDYQAVLKWIADGNIPDSSATEKPEPLEIIAAKLTINSELAKPAGNPFTILKALRTLGKI